MANYYQISIHCATISPGYQLAPKNCPRKTINPSPDKLKLCQDSHWIYRGCGNSQVAVFDVVQHEHERIVELHLRRSEGGI